jgi:hypothetical protein
MDEKRHEERAARTIPVGSDTQMERNGAHLSRVLRLKHY